MLLLWATAGAGQPETRKFPIPSWRNENVTNDKYGEQSQLRQNCLRTYLSAGCVVTVFRRRNEGV